MLARIRKTLVFCLPLLIAACASYDGRGLRPGVATVAEVVGVMGEPAQRWREADGSEQLAFPRGPFGVHTYMAFFAPDGRLTRLENVLEARYFRQVRPGQDDLAAVSRLLGPSNPDMTVHFKARNEVVREWLFCSEWNRLTWFDVSFDATSGLVRSTSLRPELRGFDGVEPLCGR